MIELIYPWALIGLGGAYFLWRAQRESVALRSAGRRRLSLALRTAVLTCVVLALADPRWLGNRRERHVTWLVDVSRSEGQEAVRRAREWIGRASQEGGPASQSIVAFGAKPVPVASPDALETFKAAGAHEEATDIAAALQFADASFPPGYTRTIALFSDGVETRGDALAMLPRLREREIEVHAIPVEPPDEPEVLVRKVHGPRQAAEGEPFRIAAEIVSNRAGRAQVDLFRNGGRVGSKEVDLAAGPNLFEVTQTIGPETLNEYAVAVRAKEDTVADNNEASTIVRGSGKSKALMVSDKPEQSRYLALALRQEGVVLDVRPPAGVPTDLSDLQNYDVVIFDNVSATDLTRRQMDLLAGYVRDFGGGFMMMGGDQAFGLGGYYQTPVEDLLPVRCDFEKERENPSLGLVLVIDKSGSMNGEKMEMAKDAAKAAVELLSPQDFVGVVGFDNEPFWVAEMQSAADQYSAQQKIATIVPGGGTNIAPGLELAYSQLSLSPARIKHVILLTDGVSTPGPFYELTSQMAQDRITVSSVAVGADSDQRLLEQIAAWGNGRYYYTDNPQAIPQIFARETMTASKSALQEFPFQPRVARPADFLGGIDFAGSPYLLGYVMTRPKPTSEVWLTTERGEPLLATWRFGLGQSAAFTSDARARWAVEWLKWDGFGKFWAQVVRRLRRSEAVKTMPAAFEPEAGGFRIVVDAVDEQGRLRSDLEGAASVVGPAGRQEKVELDLVAPGRLAGWFPAAERGAYHAQIALRKDGQPVEQQYLSATLGYPEEFQFRPVDRRLLGELAAGTGGKVDPTPADFSGDDRRQATVERELWPWLLMLALGLFVGDVAARRWPEE